MKNTLDVEIEKPDGSTDRFQVVADDRESRAYEAEFQELITEARLDQRFLAQLAWLASRRKHLFEGTFEEFLEQAAQVEVVRDKESGEVRSPDPTQSADTEI